ncbi:hypothetical protein Plhal304r1_c010g0040571 [Plasmopara halstedii]
MITKGVKSNAEVETLKQKLRMSVNQAVDAVCSEWEQRSTSPQPSNMTMEQSYGSCRKLVAYILANMDTSPGFVEQMDRIILACFSGASKRVLNAVVTHKAFNEVTTSCNRHRESSRANLASIEDATVQDDVVIKQEKYDEVITSNNLDGPAFKRRELAQSLLTKRPRSRTTKMKLSTKKRLHAPNVIKPKKLLQRHLEANTAIKSVKGDTESGNERKRRKQRKVLPKQTNIIKSAPPVEDERGLLTFKEAIGELCYQERHALLCRPPPGKVCMQNCRRIREGMCKSTAPCQDEMCRIWHDVEAHTDRCENLKCEFKLRILVRETMHKLHIKQLETSTTNQKLRKKTAAWDDLNASELSEPGSFTETIALLEREIEDLKRSLVAEESGIAEIHNALHQYWATLHEIGIESKHDDIDHFPEFGAHYAIRKKRK